MSTNHLRRIKKRMNGFLEKISKDNLFAGALGNKAIYIYLSLLYLYLSRFLGSLYFFIVLVVSAVIVFLSEDSIQALKKHKVFNLLIAFYVLWITISYLMHYFALVNLDRLSYITADGNTVFWGLATLNQSTAIYLLFPLLLFLLIYVFRSKIDLHKWLCLSPLLFLPSTILSMYQAYINQGFLNPNQAYIAGLSTDASAFGISLFFLLPLCVLGFFSYQKLWGKVVFAFLAFIQLWCIVLRGQHTTLMGIFLFFLVLPFIYYWVNSPKSKLYRLKFFGFYFCILFLTFGFGIYEIQNNSLNTSSLSNYFTSYFRYFQGYDEGGVKQVVQEMTGERAKYGVIAIKATMGAPTSGWGPGGFYRILADIIFKSKKEHLHIHNAANHYLQMSSEFGVLGFLFNLSLHLIPLWMVFAIRKKIQKKEDRWAVAIIFSVLVILMIIYITGPHGMAKDVLWFIVTLNAYIYVMAMRHGHRFNQINYKKVSVFLIVLTFIFAAGTYNSSFGENGYKAKQQSDWWPLKNQYGFYGFENWNEGPMRWTMKKAQARVKPDSDLMGFKVVAHSANSSQPEGLKVTLFCDDILIDEINFFNGGTQLLYYYLPSIKTKEVDFRIEVSNTFNPRKMGFSNDTRDLGVAMSPISYLKIMPKDGVGFHNWETSGNHDLREWPPDRPLNYRMTGMRGSINLQSELQNGGRLLLRCGHPNIGDNPVQVNILADSKLIKQELIADYNWKKVIVKKEDIKGAKGLTLQVSRTWNPKLSGISNDGRDLGVAVALLKEKL